MKSNLVLSVYGLFNTIDINQTWLLNDDLLFLLKKKEYKNNKNLFFEVLSSQHGLARLGFYGKKDKLDLSIVLDNTINDNRFYNQNFGNGEFYICFSRVL